MTPWNNVPIETYLNTHYRPDCDYVEGTLRGRNVCLRPHSDAMCILGALLQPGTEAAEMFAAMSLRVRISDTRYRVADLCVVRKGTDDDHAAPALCLEILSAEQTLDDMIDRVADYRLIGVPDIWLVDPTRQKAWNVAGEIFQPQQETLSALEGKLQINLAELYSELEEDWPLASAEQRIAETIAMLEAERQNRPEGWFFSEENQNVFA